MADISLFSGYSQKENRVTNYSILLVKLLYEESPKMYEHFLSELLGEPVEALPTFAQQQKHKTSIPDAAIKQSPYDIFIETKDSEWFYDDQLRRHLDNLEVAGTGTRALIALSPFESGGQDKLTEQLSHELGKRSVKLKFRALSFREFLDCFPELPKETFLARVKREFQGYLQNEGLLGSWKDWLDVVNCATWPEHFIKQLVYTCPLSGSAYSHSRCKYLGLYKDRQVSHVALIRGVVEAPLDGNSKVVWNNDDTPETELVDLAKQRAEAAWGKTKNEALRIFVLGTPHPTSFRKSTKGGMFGPKRYFNVRALDETRDAEGLAERLRGRSWDEMNSD